MEKVNRDVAVQEINKWLDVRKVPEKRREELSGTVDVLVDAVVSGSLIVDKATGGLELTVESIDDKKLKFKPRIRAKELRVRVSKLSSAEDAMGMQIAYASALTDVTMAVLENLDMDEFKIVGAIVVFFT